MSISLLIPILSGWLAGLIINYLADVLPITRTLSRPTCIQCRQELPLIDYILLRRCRSGHHRSWRTWIVLLAGLAASLYTWLQPPVKLGYFLGLILSIYFGVVIIIDLEHRLILHPTSLVGAFLGIIVGFISHGPGTSLLGGFSGLAIMLVFYYMGVLFARYRTKRMLAAGQAPDDEEALGAGDVILVTILGLMLGWPLIWFGLVVGILLGGAVSLSIILWQVIVKKYRESAFMLFIPFGPYFISGAYLIIFFPVWLSKIVPD